MTAATPNLDPTVRKELEAVVDAVEKTADDSRLEDVLCSRIYSGGQWVELPPADRAHVGLWFNPIDAVTPDQLAAALHAPQPDGLGRDLRDVGIALYSDAKWGDAATTVWVVRRKRQQTDSEI